MDNSWAIVDFCPWRKLLPAQSTALFLFELDSFFLYPRKKEVGQRSIIVSLHFRIPFFDVSICQIPSDLQVSRHRLFPLFCFAFDVLFVKKADFHLGIFPQCMLPYHGIVDGFIDLLYYPLFCKELEYTYCFFTK